MKNTAAVLQIKLTDSLQNMIKTSMVFGMPKKRGTLALINPTRAPQWKIISA
jgi:hypothetical protein